jgi:two-component system alkaline phosphatase synthesis response regulator PhoP
MYSEDKKSILVVDDEHDILEFLSYNLKREGFLVDTANNGKIALELVKQLKPDVVLLDVMMPEMDGIEVCDQIRKTPGISKTLIAMLTARAEVYSQIAGFEAGADDYILKPIKPKLLISRIKALLKRASYPESDHQKQSQAQRDFGNLLIDLEKHKVVVDSVDVELPKKEFLLLSLLTSKPSKVFSRDEIYDHIWGDDVFVSDRTIDVYIRKLREKIGQDRIKTIKSVGYRFEA